MKVSELRNKLKNRKIDELQLLIVEMYKAVPKAVREAKGIDQLIDDPSAFKKKKSNASHISKQLDFPAVEAEVQLFIKNAYDHNYIAPNRIISKKERSGWRITAKRLIDEVAVFSNHPDHYKAGLVLYEELYKLFCYASSYHVFVSEHPFRTLKIEQADFLKRIILLKKKFEYPDKWVTESLTLILENEVDFETLPSVLLEVLMEALDNAPLKEKMIDIAEKLLQEKQLEMKHTEQIHDKYLHEEYINNLVEIIFKTKSLLGENEEAVGFYKQNYINTTAEVKLYILLNWIMDFQRLENWLEVYEKAIKRKIKPRDILQRTYEYIKSHNEFPANVWDI